MNKMLQRSGVFLVSGCFLAQVGCGQFAAQGGLLLPLLATAVACSGSKSQDSVPTALNGWACRRKLTFNNATSPATLTNFPVLVNLTNGVNIEHSITSATGADLRFVAADGTLLDHEIDVWDRDASSVVWVRIPSITAGTASEYIYMYYGNPTATSTQNPTGVWNTNYVNVNHMNSTLRDSSPTANHATDSGTTDASGKIGRARRYNGTSSNVSHPATGMLSTAGTVLIWARPTAFPAATQQTYAFSHRIGALDNRTYLLVRNSGAVQEYRIGIGDQFNNANTQTGEVFVQNAWHMLAMTWSAGASATYLNGNPTATATGAFTWAGGVNTIFHTGQYTGGGEFWTGELDELRVLNSAQPAAWIRAQYLSMTGAFVTYSSAERL